LLFSAFNFQDPRELSAAKAAVVEVMVRAARASVRKRFIWVLLVLGVME
jgi:hypothetical protein